MSKLTRLRPTLGRIVVTPMPEDTKTESGIILVTAREHSTHVAIVVEVCDPYVAGEMDMDASDSGPNFKPGDIVVIGKWTGAEVTIGQRQDSKKYIIINESDVLATLHEEETDGNSPD